MIQRTFRRVFRLTMMLTSIFRIEASFIARMPQRACRSSKHWAQDYDYNEFENNALLGTALGRAMRTMSTRANASDVTEQPVSTIQTILQRVATLDSRKESNNREQLLQQSLRLSTNRVLGTAMGRAMRTLTTTTTPPRTNATTFEDDKNDSNISNAVWMSDTKSTQEHPQLNEQINKYLTNPAITPTALAHLLWSHILRPNVDTAIDATCGNGNDSLAIASLLFTNSSTSSIQSQLICIDISSKACETTRNRLAKLGLGETIVNHHVAICHTSHSPLLLPVLVRATTSPGVGLVCYNLGYLPNTNDTKQNHRHHDDDDDDNVRLTQMDTTVMSMADAVLMLRVGGMLSVITYPRTNRNEDYAVRALLEGLALVSSRSMDWRDYVNELGPDHPDKKSNSSNGNKKELLYSVRDTVRTALERIVANDGRTPRTTWRVMEHKLLGRALSPILLTATRIR